MKNLAITGARGFVGRSLSESFIEKYNIIPITRNTFNLLSFDETQKFFKQNQIDVIIHCANEGGSRKTGYDANSVDVIGNNLKMFYNLKSCLNPHMKMISFGSGAQYNKARDLIKVSENEIGMNIPHDDYGFSKYVISQNTKQDNLYIPIIFGLFGKYEDYRFKFISNSIIKNLLGLPIVINQNVIFDYMFIDDFIKIIDLYIENDYIEKQFNITPTNSIDLISIANCINNCSEYKSEIIVKNKGLNFQYTASNKRMLSDIGDFSFSKYEDSISKTFNYYKENLNKIDVECIRKDEFINYCKVNKNEKN